MKCPLLLTLKKLVAFDSLAISRRALSWQCLQLVNWAYFIQPRVASASSLFPVFARKIYVDPQPSLVHILATYVCTYKSIYYYFFLILGLSKRYTSYTMLVLGRLLIGVNAGINAGLVPMYLSEISPLHLRGMVKNNNTQRRAACPTMLVFPTTRYALNMPYTHMGNHRLLD